MKKVLIIKLGYSETLNWFLGLDASLGDVLRTTFILNYYKNYNVSWLVDKAALPLVQNNRYVDRALTYDSYNVDKIKNEKFDIIINFEKSPEICKISDNIEARRHYGFNYKSLHEKDKNYAGNSKNLIRISQDRERRTDNKFCWQHILAGALEEKWQGEKYILGYEPKTEVKYDIGLNWTTSNKWENKAWPRIYWERLDQFIRNKYSVSWQQGLNNLYDYMDWINSCRLIVTADTLGLHLALTLEKRIVALFGPTAPEEIYFYHNGSYLVPEVSYDCIPCFKFSCNKEKMCMEYISPDAVKERIDYEFKKSCTAGKL